METQEQMLRQQEELNDDAESSNDEDDEQKRTLFCGGLDDRVTEEILYEVFMQAGPVESVRIPKDKGGKARGFGFVVFAHACSTPYAMQLLQGLALFRRQLTIKYQGLTNAQQQRAPPPFDCEAFVQRRSIDNSGYNFAAYDPTRNPFKANGEDDYSPHDSVADRITKHASNQRPHQLNAYMPYHRNGRDSHERRQHHNDKNRRSDRSRNRHR